VDVDHYGTFSPQAEGLLVSTVKPAARTQWTLFRDAYIPFNNYVDGRVNSGTAGFGAVALATGPVDDALVNPGWCHEPNFVADVYPNVVRGASDCKGSRNSYAAYASAPHLWADGQLFRTEPLIRPNNPLGVSPPVPAGPFITDAVAVAGPAYPRSAGDHRRHPVHPGVVGQVDVMVTFQHDEVPGRSRFEASEVAPAQCGGTPAGGGADGLLGREAERRAG
jgi:hypothetical protein